MTNDDKNEEAKKRWKRQQRGKKKWEEIEKEFDDEDD